MRRLFPLVALAVVVLTGCNPSVKDAGTTPGFTAPPTPVARTIGVVAIGDSITEQDADPKADVLGTGWFADVIDLDPKLEYLWNAGIGGNTTAQMLARLGPDVLDRHPQVVFILGGTNDYPRVTTRVTVSHLRQIVAAVRGAGARPVLFSVPPRSAAPAAVITLNAAIKTMARAQSVPYIDTHDAVSSATGAYRAGYSPDGIHPTPAAALAMAKAAFPQLVKLGI